MYHKSII